MNHYLVKLLKIERPANEGSVSFVSAPTRLEAERRDEENAATAANGFVSSVSAESRPFENPKCATEANRQNRQNPNGVSLMGQRLGQ